MRLKRGRQRKEIHGGKLSDKTDACDVVAQPVLLACSGDWRLVDVGILHVCGRHNGTKCVPPSLTCSNITVSVAYPKHVMLHYDNITLIVCLDCLRWVILQKMVLKRPQEGTHNMVPMDMRSRWIAAALQLNCWKNTHINNLDDSILKGWIGQDWGQSGKERRPVIGQVLKYISALLVSTLSKSLLNAKFGAGPYISERREQHQAANVRFRVGRSALARHWGGDMRSASCKKAQLRLCCIVCEKASIINLVSTSNAA